MGYGVSALADAIIDVLRFQMEKGMEPELPSAKQVQKLSGYSPKVDRPFSQKVDRLFSTWHPWFAVTTRQLCSGKEPGRTILVSPIRLRQK